MQKKLLLTVCLIVFLSLPLYAATTLELAVGSVTTALSTELNSKTSNSWTSASSVVDNRIGQTLNGYMICRVEFQATFAANPTAGGAFTGYFLKNVDGTNYEDTPTATVGLNRLPDFVIPVTTGQTGTRAIVDVRCPAERFKAVGQLTATGQTTAASGNTLKILPITIQGNP